MSNAELGSPEWLEAQRQRLRAEYGPSFAPPYDFAHFQGQLKRFYRVVSRSEDAIPLRFTTGSPPRLTTKEVSRLEVIACVAAAGEYNYTGATLIQLAVAGTLSLGQAAFTIGISLSSAKRELRETWEWVATKVLSPGP